MHKRLIVDAEYSHLIQLCGFNAAGYAQLTINKTTVLLHRWIMEAPADCVVDHINGNILDNRKVNLQLCTQSQNIVKAKLRNTNTSGYRGVSKNGKGWKAKLVVSGQDKNLGTFKTKEDAARAYNKAALEYFGSFAQLNEV